MKYLESLRQAMMHLAGNIPYFMIIGEDIVDPYGGAFKVTKGISSSYPASVLSTPISEAAIIGIGCGRSLKGLPTIVEIMFGDFITLGCDQIINQASKIQNMYGVRIDLPLVLRVPMGGYRGYGPTHSQSLESLFINTCQLRILSPSIFSDPGLLLIKAVDDKKLTLFIEHKANYSKDLVDSKFNDYDLNVEVLNDGDIFSPIICGLNICKTQPVDAFIFTYGFQANLAIEAIIKSFMEDEYHVKLIVYSDILDLKLHDLHEKCSPVGKFLILQEAQIESGWANYACSQIQKKFFNYLKAPVFQVGAQHSPIPSAIELEASHLPSVNSIYDELRILIEHNYKS